MISSRSELLNECNLCPRHCGVNRNAGERGACGESSVIRAARAALHMWEEPCISGTRGSGTVFFTGCPLRCVFCQNRNIATGNVGKEITVERLAEIFLEQQDRGANNINLVTPTHFVPQIADALIAAKKLGLAIPIVYNTGSYENADTLKMLDGLVDVYLPDLKYMSPGIAEKYSHAPDYFDVAAKAIEEMYRQTGTPSFSEGGTVEDGIMTKGVIVRHLMLPGCFSDSKAVVKYIYDTYKDNVYISIMSQYTPMEGIGNRYPELADRVSRRDYDRLVDYAIDIGVINGFIQDGDTADESFIPVFDTEGI